MTNLWSSGWISKHWKSTLRKKQWQNKCGRGNSQQWKFVRHLN